MTQINLRVYKDPGQIEVFCGILMTDGIYERITTIIDTGAAISLFPIDILEQVVHDVELRESISLQQAGIARHAFDAIECIITVVLEDLDGNKTDPFEIPAWFAETGIAVLGFAGVLDRSVLHVDMPNLMAYLQIEA